MFSSLPAFWERQGKRDGFNSKGLTLLQTEKMAGDLKWLKERNSGKTQIASYLKCILFASVGVQLYHFRQLSDFQRPWAFLVSSILRMLQLRCFHQSKVSAA